MPHSRWRSAALAAGALSLVLAPLAALAEPTAATTHVVQPGETLWDIADNLGIDTATLVKLNGLDDANLLSVRQSLSVPGNVTRATPPAASSPAAPTAARTYTVADGDTLWAIAHQFGTTTSALVAANNLDDPDHLALGTQLVVPAAGGAAAAPAPVPVGANATAPQPAAANAAAPQPAAAPPAAPRVQASPATSAAAPGRGLLVSYTVQPGETLNQIAHQFDVRADAVAQASGLDDPNRLSVGLVLKVPLPGKEHVVSAGETLRDIALQEKVDLGSLVDFNQLDDPELIRVGQVVLLPVPATQPAAAPVAPSSPPMAAAPADASAPPPQAAAPSSAPKPAAVQPPPNPAPTRASAESAPTAVTTPAAGQVAPTAMPTPAAGQTAPNAVPTPAAGQAAPTPVTTPAAGQAAPTPAAGQTAPTAVPAPAAGQVAAGKASAPLAVLAPPKGSPSDGLAGAALKLLGAPYAWGGSSPSGFDCSGFVWYVARQAGRPLSRGMLGEYNGGSHPARDELKPGDLVFFQNTYHQGLSHNGIYIGNGQFVNAADEEAGVTISSLGTPYWSGHWFGATRLP